MCTDNSFVKDPLMVDPVGSCKVDQENKKNPTDLQ